MNIMHAMIAANICVTLFNVVGMSVGAKPPSMRNWVAGWVATNILFILAAYDLSANG